MDLLAIHKAAHDPDFVAKVEVAAVIAGVANPRVWAGENAVAAMVEFDKARSDSDEALLKSVKNVAGIS